MENAFAPYECQFTIEERKKIVAQAIQEIRKARNFSQKEVAALLGLSSQDIADMKQDVQSRRLKS